MTLYDFFFFFWLPFPSLAAKKGIWNLGDLCATEATWCTSSSAFGDLGTALLSLGGPTIPLNRSGSGPHLSLCPYAFVCSVIQQICNIWWVPPVVRASLVAQRVKNLPQCGTPGLEPWVRKIHWRREWQPTPVFLHGEIPWTEESGALQSMGSKNSRIQLSD